MINGIIIDGKQYEVQEVGQELKANEYACDVCDLKEKCDALGEGNQQALCVILHGAGCDCAYRYVGKADEQ